MSNEEQETPPVYNLYRRHHPVRIWMFHISVNEMNNVNALDSLRGFISKKFWRGAILIHAKKLNVSMCN
jgi:hypothetical protein